MPKAEIGLVQALRQGIDALREGRQPRVTRVRIKAPPSYTGAQVARIRAKKLHQTQSAFAMTLGVSRSAVRSWEQKQRRPSGAVCRLIQLADKKPEILKQLIEA